MFLSFFLWVAYFHNKEKLYGVDRRHKNTYRPHGNRAFGKSDQTLAPQMLIWISWGMLISFGSNLKDTPRNVSPAIWPTLSPDKLTHKIDYHRYMPSILHHSLAIIRPNQILSSTFWSLTNHPNSQDVVGSGRKCNSIIIFGSYCGRHPRKVHRS